MGGGLLAGFVEVVRECLDALREALVLGRGTRLGIGHFLGAVGKLGLDRLDFALGSLGGLGLFAPQGLERLLELGGIAAGLGKFAFEAAFGLGMSATVGVERCVGRLEGVGEATDFVQVSVKCRDVLGQPVLFGGRTRLGIGHFLGAVGKLGLHRFDLALGSFGGLGLFAPQGLERLLELGGIAAGLGKFAFEAAFGLGMSATVGVERCVGRLEGLGEVADFVQVSAKRRDVFGQPLMLGSGTRLGIGHFLGAVGQFGLYGVDLALRRFGGLGLFTPQGLERLLEVGGIAAGLGEFAFEAAFGLGMSDLN